MNGSENDAWPGPGEGNTAGPPVAGRLDHAVAAAAAVSRREAQRLIDQGAVRLNGRAVGRSARGRRVGERDRIEVDPRRGRVVPEPAAELSVVASGPGWIGVSKPAGVAVHPRREGEVGTLLNAAVARYPSMQAVGSGPGEGGLRCGVVHRLDTATSGAMLLATEAGCWQRLRQAFARHRIRKTYVAVVEGHPEERGEAEVWLKVRRHRPARVGRVAADTPGARRCTLAWRVTQRGASTSRLEIELGTGFLHQIRATLASMGYPVCGDEVYGAGGAAGPGRRLGLHAWLLEYEEIRVEVAVPADLGPVR